MNVTERDYELLSQYLDRELSSSDSKLLEQRLAEEPELKAGLVGLQSLQDQLQGAYRVVANEPVPERIIDLLQPEPTRIVPLPHRRVSGWGFALAASLVVAASATLVTQWGPHSTLPADPEGADPMLALTLESAPSRATGWDTLADGRRVRPVLSFHSHTGNWCREYLVAGDDGNWRGVACRGDEGWASLVFTSTDLAGSSHDYRPAGATDSDAVADFISRNAADIPLDSTREAELIARKWQ